MKPEQFPEQYDPDAAVAAFTTEVVDASQVDEATVQEFWAESAGRSDETSDSSQARDHRPNPIVHPLPGDLGRERRRSFLQRFELRQIIAESRRAEEFNQAN
jgi:hypothetical protein